MLGVADEQLRTTILDSLPPDLLSMALSVLYFPPLMGVNASFAARCGL
jgi:hypothetical protein